MKGNYYSFKSNQKNQIESKRNRKKIENEEKQKSIINLTRGTVILTSPQQIFLRPQPIFCEFFKSMKMND